MEVCHPLPPKRRCNDSLEFRANGESCKQNFNQKAATSGVCRVVKHAMRHECNVVNSIINPASKLCTPPSSSLLGGYANCLGQKLSMRLDIKTEQSLARLFSRFDRNLSNPPQPPSKAIGLEQSTTRPHCSSRSGRFRPAHISDLVP